MRKTKHLLFTTESQGEWVYSWFDITNLLCVHVYKEFMQCKSVCDIKSVIDPLPFWLGHEQKMLGFTQVLRPIKSQGLLEKRKNDRNVFWTGVKIHFSEKNILGLGAL